MGKRMWVSHTSMNVSVSGNFAVTGFDMAPSFQHTGTWYNYFTGEEINISDASGHTIFYNPGDYYVFTDVQLDRPYINLTFNVSNASGDMLENASVIISGYAGSQTDAIGNATFIYGSNFTVHYTVSKPGYQSVSGDINLGTDDHIEYVVLQTAIGVNDHIKKKIRIYPNPVDHIITIEATGTSEIIIYNVTGMIVKILKPNSDIVHADISDLSPGIYNLFIKNKDHNHIEKIIVH
jgi:hypothetical protein